MLNLIKTLILTMRNFKKEWLFYAAAVATILAFLLAAWNHFESKDDSEGTTEIISPPKESVDQMTEIPESPPRKPPTEVVTSPTESPNPMKEPILIGRTVEEVRTVNGVRPMMELEEGDRLSEVRNGVYGYMSGISLGRILTDSAGPSPSISRELSSWGTVEIHKTRQGQVMLLVYVDESSAVRLTEMTEKVGTVFVFFQPDEKRPEMVVIPVSRIVEWEHRSSAPGFAEVIIN